MQTFAVVLAAASLPIVAPRPAAAQIAYVASRNNGRVVSVDTASGQQGVPASVPTAVAIAITPDGATAYVASYSGDAVTPIDTASDAPEPAIAIRGGADSIAASPDGRTVYVTSSQANSVTPIATATNVAGPPITVDQPTGIAIAPDGRTAYVLSASNTLTPIDLATDSVRRPITLSHEGKAIAITPDGSLALVAETDAPVYESTQPSYLQLVKLVSAQAEPPIELNSDAFLLAIAIAPNGRTAYVSGGANAGAFTLGSSIVVPFYISSRTIGSDPWGGGGPVTDVAVSGDSASVFATVPCNDYHCVSSVAWVIDGATNMVTGSLDTDSLTGPSEQALFERSRGYHLGGGPSSIALVPGPSAAFTAAPGQAGSPSSFDASASSDPGGSVTSYAWQFGDNTPTVITAGATVGHRYLRPGGYTVTLATTSEGGCAAMFVFTGQTASCTGSQTATTRRTVTVTAPVAPPEIRHVLESRRIWREGTAPARISRSQRRSQRKRAKRAPVGTTFSFLLNDQAMVTLRFMRALPGRKVGHRCVARKPKPRGGKSCTRLVTAGLLAFTGHSGANAVVFQGFIASSKRLKPGRYLLVISAKNAAGHSAPKSLAFTIVR